MVSRRNPLAQIFARGVGRIGAREPARRKAERERLASYCVL
jgi:hypothetical protein